MFASSFPQTTVAEIFTVRSFAGPSALG